MPPYHFQALLNSDGTVEVQGGYVGTWTQLGSSSQFSLAIANFGQESITCYNGNILGAAMGGQMTGRSSNGKVVRGEWTAHKQVVYEAPEGKHSVPA